MSGEKRHEPLTYPVDTFTVPGFVDPDTLAALVADGFAICTSCHGATDHVGADVVNGRCECGADALCGVFELLSRRLIILAAERTQS
jgi:hypothetical protein